jgi:adenylate cyclase
MGSDRRIKYGVVGQAVNLASRIEAFSVGGQILVSEAIRNAVSDSFQFAGPYTVWPKGVGRAVTLWEVRGVPGKSSHELPPTVPGLTVLAQPVHVFLRQIVGKGYNSEGVPAQIVRLSTSGAELECGFEMDYFVSVQITLTPSPGMELSVDGKVVGPGDKEGRWIIRFSGLDQPVGEAIQEILASGGDW